ncbi:MAG TPA: FxsA family protein [Rubricoccaceae bacterium]|jgi:UPF0716 protein FxsA
MAVRLLLLFLLVPAAEIAVLIAVGDRVGFLPTVALVVFAAVAGSFLARREGLAVWRRVQARLAQGGVPGPELVDGLIVFAASVLLLTPGFLSDVAGLLGLFPPTRALVRRFALRQFEKRVADGRLRVSPLGPVRPPVAHAPAAVEDAEVVDDGRRAISGSPRGRAR